MCLVGYSQIGQTGDEEKELNSQTGQKMTSHGSNKMPQVILLCIGGICFYEFFKSINSCSLTNSF